MANGTTAQQSPSLAAPTSVSWDPRSELQGLTSLRGIAAITVVLFHIEVLVERRGVDLALGPFRGVVENGYLFVDMFFILSGLVIAHVYAQRTFNSAKKYGRFLWNRLARIYPLHLFVTLFLIAGNVRAGSLFTEPNTARALVSELLLVKSLGFHDVFTWNDVSWSVSAEWISYLLAPMILLLARPGRSSVPMAVAVIVASWMGLSVLAVDGSLGDATQVGGAIRGVLGFAGGVALYRLHRLDSVVSVASRTFAFPASVAATLVLMSIDVDDVMLMPVFFALILTTIYAPKTVIRGLDSKPMVHLGNISYSVYLLQTLAILLFRVYLNSKPSVEWVTVSQWSVWAAIAICLAGLIAVSHLTYKTLERPAQAAMRRIGTRPKSAV